MPCHFTGTAGIKPSHLRFAHRGSPGAVPGRPLVNANDGPMCKDIETVVEFSRAVWGDTYESEQDPYVPPVLWNEKAYSSTKPLRIGYYLDDGWFTPTPAIQRAVLEAKKHLEAAGHTVVKFQPPNVPKMFQMYIRALTVDGGRYLRGKLMAVRYCNIHSNLTYLGYHPSYSLRPNFALFCSYLDSAPSDVSYEHFLPSTG